MFDLSFWEILVIGIIAVIVVGPERLPGMAYTAGKWITKVKRFVANARAEVESEFNTTELRKLMSAQEEEMQKLRKLVEDTRHDVEQSTQILTQSVDEATQAVRDATAPEVETPPAINTPTLSKTPSPTVATQAASVLPAMTAKTIEDEMLTLSQSLGETLHRPSFGASSQPTPHVPAEPTAPSSTPSSGASSEVPAPKASV
ncbi:MAG: twin arginine-targeting protein translocase TatB [Gammaproteobacteria bacterium 28-57-27]|nr:MAG: twin arginine-targeting protein translocase TatB [Gammaproteobacteria bacterium 28-57-27]